MTPHQIIAAAVRLLAVWFALYVLTALYPLLFGLERTDLLITILFGVGIALLSITIIFCLWRFAQTIARRVLPGEANGPLAQAPVTSVDTWFAVGCALIGV